MSQNKKIVITEKVIDSCNECPHCIVYSHNYGGYNKHANICHYYQKERLVKVNLDVLICSIPKWCPLKTYIEGDNT